MCRLYIHVICAHIHIKMYSVFKKECKVERLTFRGAKKGEKKKQWRSQMKRGSKIEFQPNSIL